jgi:hypothetical protein
MTACLHFRGKPYINHEPCGAGIDNYGKLDLWPCIHYGKGFCNEHTIGEAQVKAEDMPGYEPGFAEFNDS